MWVLWLLLAVLLGSGEIVILTAAPSARPDRSAALADDPELAAALTRSPRSPQAIWAPIRLRVLAILLIAVAVLTSAPVLVLATLVVFGIAQLPWSPSPPRSTTAGGDDVSPLPRGS